jgi:hypothetical protein
VNWILLGGIILAVEDSRARARKLHGTSLEDFLVAHGVSMLKGTIEDHGEDLVVRVRVRTEAIAAGHAVLIDYAKWTEPLKFRVIITGKSV